MAELSALALIAEVGDRRRFPSARSLLAFTGLVLSEGSAGASQRRGQITETDNAEVRTQLGESAWSYQHRPLISTCLEVPERRQCRFFAGSGIAASIAWNTAPGQASASRPAISA